MVDCLSTTSLLTSMIDSRTSSLLLLCFSNCLARRFSSIVHIDNQTRMSNTLIHELDLKMQQMKEYALVTHGYHNENFQYPIQVRRSHDGEKMPRTLPTAFGRTSRNHRLMKTPLVTSSSHENQTTKTKSKRSYTSDEHTRTFIVPPNKTVNDIDPCLQREQVYTTGSALTRFYVHRKSSSSSLTSSSRLGSYRPHSIACLSTTETNTTESSANTSTTIADSQPTNSLFNSSQSIINQSNSRTPIRTMTQKFFSRFFHNPSKS
jgi:hypothetical protein